MKSRKKYKIGIIGAGHVGSLEGRLWLKAGHEVMYGSRSPKKLKDKELGTQAKIGTVQEAIAFGEIVLLATPWEAAETLLKDISPFRGKIVIDASNPYVKKDDAGPQTPDNLELKKFPKNSSATQHRTLQLENIALVKSYNLLTAKFQEEAASRKKSDKIVMPYAGNDKDAKQVVAQLIEDSGFKPFDVGSAEMGRFIEPPRGKDSLYGEEWTLEQIEERLEDLKESSKKSD